MVFLFLGGFICQWNYKKSPRKAVDINEVRHTIRNLERSADAKMGEIERMLENGRTDSLIWIPFEKLFITYLVYEDGRLIFGQIIRLSRKT